MNWLSSHWRIAAIAAVSATIGATATVYFWPTAVPSRQLLYEYKFDSRTYFEKQGQPWLTAPAAASTSCRWKMTEAAGNVTDDLCGSSVLTANGSPKYQLFTPIPTTSGFTRKAIGFVGSEWFAAGDNALGDQTTNGFSVNMWFCIWSIPGANAHLVSKRTGNNGYGVYLSTTNVLTIEIGDGTLTTGAVSAALAFGCHYATVKWDRASVATAVVDGVQTDVTVDISARSGSVTSATPLTIGRLSSGGNAFTGSIAEVMVSNGTTTDLEHASQYLAFRVPYPYVYSSAIPRPAAASNAWRWSMQDAASPIRDDLSGASVALTATGTPLYQQWTTLPKGRMVVDNWKGIKFTANGQYFEAADTTVGNFGTGSFTLALRFYTMATSAKMLISKGSCAGGTGCFQLSQTAANVLNLYLQDPAGHTLNVTLAPAMPNNSWRHVVVRVDRTTNSAMAYLSGTVTTSSITSISTITGSLSNTDPLRIGSVGASNFLGIMSGIMISDGLMTFEEMRNNYMPFIVKGINYPGISGTPRKFDLKPDATGVRLGVFSTTQWPVMYHSALERTTGDTYNPDINPGGLGFPSFGSMTNVIGYPTRFDQWTAAGVAPPVVVADTFEAPDGSWTADQVTFGNDTSTLTKTVVGGGNTVAYDRWYASLYYKYISGAACDIRVYNGTTRYTTLGTGATWTRASVDIRDLVEAKRIQISRNAGTDCVYAFSDAQYQTTRLGPPCTSGYTDANVVCSASYSVSMFNPPGGYNLGTGALGPYLDRGEIDAVFVSDISWAQTAYDSVAGPRSYTTALLSTTIGGNTFNSPAYPNTEAFTISRPAGAAAERRHYSFIFDLRDGLTNTTPRKYLASLNNGEFDYLAVAPRLLTDTAQPTFSPTPLKSYAGLHTSTYPNPFCVMESIRWYTRPEKVIRKESTKHVITVDTTGPNYLANASIPRFECPAGVSTSNCFIMDNNEFMGTHTAVGAQSPLYDRYNDAVFTSGGAGAVTNHLYSVNSGLLARGVGRRSVRFTRSTNGNIKAASRDIPDISGLSGMTLEVLYYPTLLTTWTGVVDSSKLGTVSGIGVYHNVNGQTGCTICSAAGGACSTRDIQRPINTNMWHHLACVFTKDPGTGIWSVATYLNGLLSTSGAGALAAVGNIYHGDPFMIGGSAYLGASSIDGQLGEVAIDNTALTAAQVLAHYKQTIQEGTFWTGNFVGHWTLSDPSSYSSVGLATYAYDSSGNNNHLSVVTGTVTSSWAELPYPAGSGVMKPSVGMMGINSWWLSAGGTPGAIAPNASNSFSMAAWIRCPTLVGSATILQKAGGDPDYRMHIDSSGRLNCRISDSGANASISRNATNLCDSNWHLVACKSTWNGANYVMTSSVNGLPFADPGAAITGTISGNASGVYLLYTGNAADRIMAAGEIVLKDHAMTDAYVASYYNRFGADPTGKLTYARSSTEGACFVTNIHRSYGVVVTCFNNDKVPYAVSNGVGTNSVGANSALWTAIGSPYVGLPTYRDSHNYVQYSEALGSWTLGNVTVTWPNSTPAPNGDVTADSMVQTVANAIHSVTSNTFAAAQDSYIGWSTHFKQGSGGGWLKLYVTEAGGSRAWVNIGMDGTLGLTGVSGADLAASYAPTYMGGYAISAATANTWVKIAGVAQCVKAGGCTMTFGACFETANNNSATCPAFVGSTSNYIFLWGAQADVATTVYPVLASSMYCPNRTNAASTTCSAPTAQYVTSADPGLTAWDRTTGVVHHIGQQANTTTTANWALHNGVNNNGAIRFASSGDGTPDGLRIYDSSAVLQQNLTGTTANLNFNPVCPHFTSWDSTAPLSGTRRSYNSYSCAYNPGPWDIYSTDTGANWTPAGGTNLWVGIDQTGEATALGGNHYLTSIWKK